MADDNSNRRLTRRNALRIAGAAGAASLAGCGGSDGGDGSSGDGSSGDGSDGSSGDGSSDGGSTDSGTQYSTLEVAHWWGEGDGLEAIQSVMDAFKEQHPDVPFDENLIAGGAGENLQANIRTRVQNGNHPSTWQAWPGNNLLPFTDANLLKDIGDSVWSENSMEDATFRASRTRPSRWELRDGAAQHPPDQQPLLQRQGRRGRRGRSGLPRNAV